MKKFILGVLLFLCQKSKAAIPQLDYSFTKNKDVQIAVIDTGIDINHQDLKNYIWTNKGEFGKDAQGRDKSSNGVDDDLNGFVDDIHGWNFIDNNNDLSDEIGHGTHIAGIIENEFFKRLTISTSSPNARLMILKYYSPGAKEKDNILNSNKALAYAKKMHADIINYSGGGAQADETEFLMLKEIQKDHIIFVAAAGNNNFNTDYFKFYPASYQLDNIISVAATNQSGDLVSFSNYGKNSVDIAAPGKRILSTLPGNKYGYMSGTSQSTAFVTGYVAALLVGTKQTLTTIEVLKLINSKAQVRDSLRNKTKNQLALMNGD